MSQKTITTAILFVAFLLAQVLIFNHIVLFGVAVPFVFIYFILRQPIDMGTSTLLTLSFLLGLGVDICSDMAGMNALACTVLAMLKRKVFFSFVLKDDSSVLIEPSTASMGLGTYLSFSAAMTAIYCILIFSIEYFSISDVKDVVIHAAASTLLTTVLLMPIDSLLSSRREKRL